MVKERLIIQIALIIYISFLPSNCFALFRKGIDAMNKYNPVQNKQIFYFVTICYVMYITSVWLIYPAINRSTYEDCLKS